MTQEPRPGGGDTPEVAALRAELAAVKAERDMYRAAAAALLDEVEPYVPPTEEELNDMLHGPRGQPLREVIAEFEAELDRPRGTTDGRGECAVFFAEGR